MRRAGVHSRPVTVDPRLLAHLVATTPLTEGEARRVVEDVIAFHGETTEEFVRRRHAQLKTYGAKNSDIYPRLLAELAQRPVAAPPLTERQLRRIIYG